MISQATQDYLKAIYALREDGPERAVTTQRLADYLGVAPPSATAMAKKLAAQGLVSHEPYRGVVLSVVGEKVALEIVRHHRLIETFLAQVLNVPWDEVHDEAEKWEHVISEAIEARIDRALNHPTHDPHGAPIPALDGSLPQEACVLLADLPPECERQVRRVNDENADVLRHLGALGVVPGATVRVLRNAPHEGVMHLRVDGRETVLGARPAREVWMKAD